MNEKNQTKVYEIFLLGFKDLHNIKIPLFILLLLTYCVTICGNVLIIVLVSYSKTLQSPMYFFLTQLSISDIMLTTDIVPTTLTNIFAGKLILSFSGCITRFYIFGCSESTECLILAVMAYDRYLAICHPLHYATIMDFDLFLKMSIISWIFGALIVIITILALFGLEFCGPNIIDHFFLEMEVFFLDIFVLILPFIMTVTSYGWIIKTILGLSSNLQRRKAFSTCSSHLTVVCIFYGTLIAIYMISTRGVSLTINKVASLLYTVVTPMLNPIIYSLRNKDIKETIRKLQTHLRCV
ncbi:hypothetical protein GDO81_008951 [Engystomops pustulosus]|uniref:Olfactory receptor n=1 Tax=Engystomops pustulosus TaxID=76066 RepID=A0AAV7BMZ1_ENGPU|nr:hypothetical protein GDO81_008951 [Engystomops pustulosus]